jgi:RNA ligase (TIGR02306 family)
MANVAAYGNGRQVSLYPAKRKLEVTAAPGRQVRHNPGQRKLAMTSTNNLAYIAKVADLRPLAGGKDTTEIALVKGWNCIVKKGQFQVGDLAVYLAFGGIPDPKDKNFKFFFDQQKRDKSFNGIKTENTGGVITQGLLCPMSWLSDRGIADIDKFKEGDDVSQEMGVIKYISPEESGQYAPGGKVSSRKAFPGFVPRTDATRIQHDPDYFLEAIRDREVTVTRKEDGCSGTFIYHDQKYIICGRNFQWDAADRKEVAADYFHVQDKYEIKEKLRALGRNIAIQGEICGPTISGNRANVTERTFSVFDAYDIDRGEYLPYDELSQLCVDLGLPSVPLLYRGPANALELTLEGFLKLAEETEYGPDLPAEGIVVKADAVSAQLGRVHFKTISNKYLLKHKL